MKVCSSLRCYCRRNEWASSACLLGGASALMLSVWAAIELQPLLLSWVAANLLVHGAAAGILLALDVGLIFGLVCLGFSDCPEAPELRTHAYRGRRSTHPRFMSRWAETLGRNPRRVANGA